MARFVYTPEMIAFVRAGYPKMGLPELAELFNDRFGTDKTHTQMRAMTKNHGIPCGRATGAILKGTSRFFTPEQQVWVAEAYQRMTRRELTDAVNAKFGLSLTFNQVSAYLKNNKIASGRSGHFEKDQVGWNKGKKGYMGPNRTSFQKGAVPANRREFGEERICSKDGYILVKTNAIDPYTGHHAYWRHKHLVIWEAANGPPPAGHMVCFVNGDKTDIRLDNLELVSRAENAIRNKMSYSALPDEIKATAALLARVYVKKHERKGEIKTP
jgi:hypothetical protein